MSFLHIKNVKIAGISTGVSKRIIDNINDVTNISANYDVQDFVATTGVRYRRVDLGLTTSDLCYHATERLISDLGWKKADIDGIIMVTQTPDYIIPATACILQDRLQLNRECYALDISLGCSGWTYGLSVAASLLQNGTMKKLLLLAGDARGLIKSMDYTKTDPLFGHAGTVTALEYAEGEEGFRFHFGTDGSGYDAIIIPDGGCRNQVSPDSFNETEFEGKTYNQLQARMKGMDVFSFGISVVPKSIKKLAEHFDLSLDSIDYFVLHQANLKMLETIRKRLKAPEVKFPYSLYEFGNTSSASIPITITTQLANKVANQKTNFIACGYGVGLSWGTVAFETKKLTISDLVEVES